MTPRDASAAYERSAALVQTIEERRLEAMVMLDASSGATESQRAIAWRFLKQHRGEA